MTPEQPSESAPVIWTKDRIGKLLPHSGEFLLPDCVIISQEERKATGFMRVPKNHITDGHFGVLPGVLQVELAYQVLAVLEGAENPNMAGVASSIRDVQFNVLAKVGDVVRVDVEVTTEDSPEQDGRLQAIATLRILRDNTRASVMILGAVAMKTRLFERMIRPGCDAGMDQNTREALASLPPEVQAAIPSAPSSVA
ncbi:MAG: hypothetical protein PHO92_00055 [Candidatus Peribacteraceae bacterium]|nr:hypothetical protein [Candidatus Peribacteraceae bacterium]